MLKTVENYNFHTKNNTKCAEIHYSFPEFSIVCLSCHQIWDNYKEFIAHFREKHDHFTSFRTDIAPLQSSHSVQLNEDVSVKKESESFYEQQEQWMLETLVVEENDEDEIETSKCADFYSCMEEDISEHAISYFEYERNIDKGLSENSKINPTEDTQTELDWSQSYAPKLLKSNQKRPYKPRNQPNRCNYCGKTFRRRYQLDTHLNIHTGLKPHQCDVCGRQFRAINTLQRHLNTHSKRETFRCKYCAKEFAHRAAYVSHETRHTQQRQVPCGNCGKLFYTINQLDTHKRKMHNVFDDNSLPYACDLCLKRYRSASMLSTHKFKKHYKSAKYFCDQCGKKFVDQEQLNDHMSIHIIKNVIS